MASSLTPKHNLGLFALTTIAVVSVDSLRNLPIGAQYGFHLVFLYLFAGITFFFPLAWVTNQLALHFPDHAGGSYDWIRHALGETIGQLSMWIQWLYNIIWYPTIFSFISVTLASLAFPHWEDNKHFLLLANLAFFWGLTFVHCFGAKASSVVSMIGAIVGTLIPMFLMIVLAFFWIFFGYPSATPIHWQSFLPDSHTFGNVSFFSNILFSLLGLDILAVYVSYTKKSIFTKSLYLGAVIILSTLIFSSLAFCIILPVEKISLIDSLIEVFRQFFDKFHIPYATHFIGTCIVLGGLGIAASWMIGLAKILNVSLHSLNCPAIFRKKNRFDSPYMVLIAQAIVFSLILYFYLLVPNINNSYWMLSALSAQFALLYYVLIFVSAFRILKKKKSTQLKERFLQVFFPFSAISVCIFGIMIGFLPPEMVPVKEHPIFVLKMVLCFLTVLFCLVSLLYLSRKKFN